MRVATADGLASAVKAFRKQRDWKIEQLADELGVPARTLEGIEQGRSFRHPTLLLLALQALPKPPTRKGKSK